MYQRNDPRQWRPFGQPGDDHLAGPYSTLSTGAPWQQPAAGYAPQGQPWQGAYQQQQQPGHALASSYMQPAQQSAGWERWLKPRQSPVRTFLPYTPPTA